MTEGRTAIVTPALAAIPLDVARPVIYDRPIGLRLLVEDPDTGAEHYLVRYPPGLVVLRHRHRAAQTLVILEGEMEVDGVVLGSGSHCHFPAGVAMHHAPAGDSGCLFVTIFDGPFDVEVVPAR